MERQGIFRVRERYKTLFISLNTMILWTTILGLNSTVIATDDGFSYKVIGLLPEAGAELGINSITEVDDGEVGNSVK